MTTDRIANNESSTLYMALELSKGKWLAAFSDGTRNPSLRSVPGGNWPGLIEIVDKTIKKFGLDENCVVKSCYEAGRDGSWIHRMLLENDIENIVVDPASIETRRGRKHKKTDKIDARKLLTMLQRYHVLGEKKVWSVVNVPSEEAEDERRVGREMIRLKKECNQHLNRMKSLIALHGIHRLPRPAKLDLSTLRDWKGRELPEHLLTELKREQKRLKLICDQLNEISKFKRERMKNPVTESDKLAAKLNKLHGVGVVCSWDLVKEFFNIYEFNNRKQVGSTAGLVPVPYSSGTEHRQSGISKEGNARTRKQIIQLSWLWIRFQKDSELVDWFNKRFDPSSLDPKKPKNKRTRKVGVVALSRKLLISLWRYLYEDSLPNGAVLRKEETA